MKMFKKIFILTSFVFFSMVLSTTAFANENYLVKVNGNASIEVAPNVANITIGVNTKEDTAKLALEKNSTIVNSIIDYLKSIGISSDDYNTANFYSYPDYKYNEDGTSTVTGTYVSNSIIVKVRDFNLVSDIINNATKLGANNISNIYYSVDDDDATYNKALQQAVQNAVKKGNAIGTALGKTNMTVTSVTESSYNDSVSSYAENSRLESADTGGASNKSVPVPVKPSTVTVYAQVLVTME